MKLIYYKDNLFIPIYFLMYKNIGIHIEIVIVHTNAYLLIIFLIFNILKTYTMTFNE